MLWRDGNMGDEAVMEGDECNENPAVYSVPRGLKYIMSQKQLDDDLDSAGQSQRCWCVKCHKSWSDVKGQNYF